MTVGVDALLVTSWRAIPGSVAAVAALRDGDVPLRLLTNTTVAALEAASDVTPVVCGKPTVIPPHAVAPPSMTSVVPVT